MNSDSAFPCLFNTLYFYNLLLHTLYYFRRTCQNVLPITEMDAITFAFSNIYTFLNNKIVVTSFSP